MKINLKAILIAGILLTGLLAIAGCGGMEGEDPAEALARQAQQAAPPPPPPADSSPAAAEEPAAAEDGAAVEGEEPAAVEEGSAVDGGQEPAPDGDGAAVEGEEPAPDGDGAAAEGEEPAAEGDGAAVEGEEPAAEGDGAAVEGEEPAGEEEVTDDPIQQFKSLDPREIIDRKYEDLQEQHTEPWDEEDPEQFIPETGRVDPLTRVFEAVPNELKPPRTGETDENEIISYFIARDATMTAYMLAYNMQCYSVLQIGIEKYATLEVFGNRFTMTEGQTAGPFNVGFSSGIPLMASMACSSISTEQVVVNITVYGEGTSTSISKSQVFIPDSWQ
jgi:hypothetical protein